MIARHGSMGCAALLALFVVGHASAATPPVKKTLPRTQCWPGIRSSDADLIDISTWV
jgi:hypothetical protein